ncbi:GntR family transcriptional regulator [Thermodesulfobacteriota bacterium]
MLLTKEIDRESYKPIYAQIGDILIKYIENNGLKAGDPIPSENELKKRYGVSSMTIRLAMQRLSTEGIITRIQGKGTFVAHNKIKEQIKGIKSLEERLAGQGIHVKNIFIEAVQTVPTRRYINELKLLEGAQTLKVRRLKKVDDQLIGLETRQIPLEIAKNISLENFKEKPLVAILNSNKDTKVYKICYRTRCALILEMESKTMGIRPNTPALVQNSIHYNRSGLPVMAGRITYLADKVELEYEVNEDDDYSEKFLLNK